MTMESRLAEQKSRGSTGNTTVYISPFSEEATKFLTALNGHDLCFVSGWLKKFWERNYLCFPGVVCILQSLALIIFLSFFTSALVWVEGKTPPSIKHNFSAYFIIFSPHPLSSTHSMIVTFALINPLSLSDILWLWFARQRLVYPLKSS